MKYVANKCLRLRYDHQVQLITSESALLLESQSSLTKFVGAPSSVLNISTQIMKSILLFIDTT